MSLNEIQGDRRGTQRYDCQLSLRLEYEDQQGTVQVAEGVAVDLSRKSLRFQSEEMPLVGTEAVTRIAWPFLLQNVCPLELILKGPITALTGRGAILAIRSYEFRTCGERSFWEAPPASSNWKVA